MNINDYTYHFCDRFVLLFIAFIGLVGTSYLLYHGNNGNSQSTMDSFGLGIQQIEKVLPQSNEVYPEQTKVVEILPVWLEANSSHLKTSDYINPEVKSGIALGQ